MFYTISTDFSFTCKILLFEVNSNPIGLVSVSLSEMCQTEFVWINWEKLSYVYLFLIKILIWIIQKFICKVVKVIICKCFYKLI